jgi:hypothetical protein
VGVDRTNVGHLGLEPAGPILEHIVGVVARVPALRAVEADIGNLPGDFSFGGRNWRVYFPLASSIVLSILLTLILWLIHYFSRR